MDGDADRLVYFYRDASSNDARLLDGDKIAALVATRVGDLTRRCAIYLRRSLRVGVVQTAYANGASTRYIETALGLETTCVPTGVKHLHPAAEAYDVGVYFEANGHGTALFSDERAARSAAVAADETGTTEDAPRRRVAARARGNHQPRGGGCAVRRAGRGGHALREAVAPRGLGRDVRGRALEAGAVRVRDRGVIVTADAARAPCARRACRRPSTRPSRRAARTAQQRAFARPSGTEDVVRSRRGRTRDIADALAREVAKIVHAHAGVGGRTVNGYICVSCIARGDVRHAR